MGQLARVSPERSGSPKYDEHRRRGLERKSRWVWIYLKARRSYQWLKVDNLSHCANFSLHDADGSSS